MMLKRARTFSIVTLLTALLMLVNVPRVSACSCAGGLPLIDHITNASAIFSGRVAELSPEEAPASTLAPDVQLPGTLVYQTSVDINQIWKGPTGLQLSVNTALDAAACGYPFQPGAEYLIYAYEHEGNLHTSLCSNTKPLEEAGSEIAILNSLFSSVPLDRLASAATVTATGHGVYYATADQLNVRLLFREGWQGDTPVETLQQQLVDLLTAHGAAEILASGRYYLGQDGFYFDIQPEGDFGTVLEQLNNIDSSLLQASASEFEGMEVSFSLQDCTVAAAGARFRAMNDARTRAELLAAQAGGKRGAIVAVVEASNPPSPEGTGSLCFDTPAQWDPIPLDSELSTAQQIIWPASVSVTFALEARIGEDSTLSIAPTPSTAQISPLPTPNP